MIYFESLKSLKTGRMDQSQRVSAELDRNTLASLNPLAPTGNDSYPFNLQPFSSHTLPTSSSAGKCSTSLALPPRPRFDMISGSHLMVAWR